MLNLIKKQNQELALISEKEHIDYQTLRERVNNLSKRFQKRTVNILICTNTTQSIISYLSLLQAGAIPLLLSSEIDLENLLRYKKKYHAKTVISPKLLDLPLVDNVWEVNNYYIYETEDFKVINNKEIVLLLTTSGSTGNPKVVKISKKNIISNTQSICEYLSISKTDRHITTLPMNYTYGLSSINTFLYSGGSIILNNYSLFERNFWNLLERYSPTSLSGVPYTYEILNRIGLKKIFNSSIKVFTQAGGKLEKKILLKFANYCQENKRYFYVMYGQTEATARMSYLPPNMLLKKIDSIGIAIPGGKFEIINESSSKKIILENNIAGELIYKGDNVSLGYAETFEDLNNKDQFKSILNTGDLAFKDKDNYIYIIGRKNRFAKINGIRVSLIDIENILNENGFSNAVISDDKKLLIFIEENIGHQNNKTIKEILIKKTTLSPLSFKIKFIKNIPRNDNGKINYFSLKTNENN